MPQLKGQAWYDTFSSVVIPFFKVFMPFIVLLFMNAAIVYSMKRRLIKERRRAMFSGDGMPFFAYAQHLLSYSDVLWHFA